MIKGCSRAMGAGFTSINTVGQLTTHLGRKYVNRIPSTFLIPKQIPPGFKKKKKRNEKEKPEQENRRERKCVLYILVYTKWEAKKKSMKKDL